jgi:hypothetical protein
MKTFELGVDVFDNILISLNDDEDCCLLGCSDDRPDDGGSKDL